MDPLENTNATAVFGPRAIAVLAVSERGGLFHAPDMYMNKLIVGPEAAEVVDLDFPVEKNLKNLAKALDRKVSDLVIVVLDRPRHEELIKQIRTAGTRVKLIPDGDLLPGIGVGHAWYRHSRGYGYWCCPRRCHYCHCHQVSKR